MSGKTVSWYLSTEFEPVMMFPNFMTVHHIDKTFIEYQKPLR